jgi:hypothetical protein
LHAVTPTSRRVRALVRLVTALFALGTLVVPAGVVAPATHGDDATAVELVLGTRTVAAPVAAAGSAATGDDDTTIAAPSTDDGLVHPDLEPHDGPPPLRGPPSS